PLRRSRTDPRIVVVLIRSIPLPRALPIKQKSVFGNRVPEAGGDHQQISWIQAQFGRRLQQARADGTLPADRAVLTKEYPLMKTAHWSLTGAALILALAPWMTVSIRADEAEDRAVKAIEKLGGRIIRDEKAKGKPIVGVNLAATPVTDADLKALAGLKQLQRLDLRQTHVTDAGLKELAGLKQLQKLYLNNTKVTDAGL